MPFLSVRLRARQRPDRTAVRVKCACCAGEAGWGEFVCPLARPFLHSPSPLTGGPSLLLTTSFVGNNLLHSLRPPTSPRTRTLRSAARANNPPPHPPPSVYAPKGGLFFLDDGLDARRVLAELGVAVRHDLHNRVHKLMAAAAGRMSHEAGITGEAGEGVKEWYAGQGTGSRAWWRLSFRKLLISSAPSTLTGCAAPDGRIPRVP